jgi:hypothetical protein
MTLDPANLKGITNSFQDVRLVSLREWSHAPQLIPCDHGGPYMVGQQGYDPHALPPTPDEFVLSKQGKWLSLGQYFKLPEDVRVREFMFGTAAEVMLLMESLPSKVSMWGQEPATQPDSSSLSEEDSLIQAYTAAEKTPLQKPAS